MWKYSDWVWNNVDRLKKALLAALILAIIICVASLSGCDTAKHATKVVMKELKSHPEVVAKIARDSFPCITVNSDTSYNYYDTTVLADCPQIENSNQYFTLHDTAFFNNIVIKKVQVPVKVPAKVITNTVADSAQLFLFAKRIVDLKGQVTKLEEKVSFWKHFSLWGIIIAFVLGAFIRPIIRTIAFWISPVKI